MTTAPHQHHTCKIEKKLLTLPGPGLADTTPGLFKGDLQGDLHMYYLRVPVHIILPGSTCTYVHVDLQVIHNKKI